MLVQPRQSVRHHFIPAALDAVIAALLREILRVEVSIVDIKPAFKTGSTPGRV